MNWQMKNIPCAIDTLGKKCRDRKENFYLYKGVVKILPLAMVDDLNGIAKCGIQSISLNTFLTTQIQFGRRRIYAVSSVNTPFSAGKRRKYPALSFKKNI